MLFLISLEAKFPHWGKNGFGCVFLFFVICCSICPQNTSLISANETTAGNSMRLNPHIQYYSTVYVISMGMALILKTMRGLVFVKVSFLRDPCHMLRPLHHWWTLKAAVAFDRKFRNPAGLSLSSFVHAHGPRAVIENSSGLNPFICPLPCSALQQACWCMCVSQETHIRGWKEGRMCVRVRSPTGARPCFRANRSWHRIAEVRSPH